MVWVSRHYTTNTDKDRAARKRRDLGIHIREHFCTKNELNKPTERNVQKCMRAMKSHIGDEWKKASKFLGEKTNYDNLRRR